MTDAFAFLTAVRAGEIGRNVCAVSAEGFAGGGSAGEEPVVLAVRAPAVGVCRDGVARTTDRALGPVGADLCDHESAAITVKVSGAAGSSPPPWFSGHLHQGECARGSAGMPGLGESLLHCWRRVVREWIAFRQPCN